MLPISINEASASKMPSGASSRSMNLTLHLGCTAKRSSSRKLLLQWKSRWFYSFASFCLLPSLRGWPSVVGTLMLLKWLTCQSPSHESCFSAVSELLESGFCLSTSFFALTHHHRRGLKMKDVSWRVYNRIH